MELPDTSGIYIIINIQNEHLYIGQAENIKLRIKKHFESLKNNKHRNSRLQNAYNKYGNVFDVIVLNECSIEELDKYEQEWLDIIRFYPSEYVYNHCFEPNTTRGYKFTDQQRLEQSNRLKGKKKHPDFGKKISDANKIKWRSGIMKPRSKKEFMIIDPNDVIHQVKGLTHFTDYHKLSSGTLHSLLSGKINQYKGWRRF